MPSRSGRNIPRRHRKVAGPLGYCPSRSCPRHARDVAPRVISRSIGKKGYLHLASQPRSAEFERCQLAHRVAASLQEASGGASPTETWQEGLVV